MTEKEKTIVDILNFIGIACFCGVMIGYTLCAVFALMAFGAALSIQKGV